MLFFFVVVAFTCYLFSFIIAFDSPQIVNFISSFLTQVRDRGELGRKGGARKRRHKPKEGEEGFLQRASDADSALEDSSSGEEQSGSDADEDREAATPSTGQTGSLVSSLQGLEDGEVSSLAWVADRFDEEAADREDEEEDAEDVPIVPIEEALQASLALPHVISVLEGAGLTQPGRT